MKRNVHRSFCMLLICALLSSLLSLPAAARFRDVPPGHWAEKEVERCVELGFFKGVDQSRFGLGEPMSRGSFAVVLCRFFHWEPVKDGALPFEDVPGDAWYAPYLAAALRHGAVAPQPRQFRPGEALTREELAVALVRALGLTPIAGLAQELSLPFGDVVTNRGYLTMAYDLGIVNGTAPGSFSPEKRATREQVAVILMRLYDKLQARTYWSGAAAGLPQVELKGARAVALGQGRLVQAQGPIINFPMDQETLQSGREAAKAAGAKELLSITAGKFSVEKPDYIQESAAILAEAVEAGAYAGLLLDVPKLRLASERDNLSELTAALKEALGEKLLYVVAEAPCMGDRPYTGYDYEALGKTADLLLLRFHSHPDEAQNITLDPVEPLEAVYYGLRQLKGVVPPEKLGLWMRTEATVWDGSRSLGTLTGLETDALLARKETHSYYSQRYGCSYLKSTLEERDVTVWYPDAVSVEKRAQLGHFFGVEQIFFGEISQMSPTLLTSVQ